LSSPNLPPPGFIYVSIGVHQPQAFINGPFARKSFSICMLAIPAPDSANRSLPPDATNP
jgi:hypothetical protein